MNRMAGSAGHICRLVCGSFPIHHFLVFAVATQAGLVIGISLLLVLVINEVADRGVFPVLFGFAMAGCACNSFGRMLVHRDSALHVAVAALARIFCKRIARKDAAVQRYEQNNLFHLLPLFVSLKIE